MKTGKRRVLLVLAAFAIFILMLGTGGVVASAEKGNGISDEEQKWVDENDTLVVGCLEDYLPYCGVEDGKVTGLIVDEIPAMLSALEIDSEINVRYEAFASYSEMINALHNGKVNVIFPVRGDEDDSKKDGIINSSAVVTSGMALVVKDETDISDVSSFSVNSTSMLLKYFVEDKYPNASILECDSVDECLVAVKDGKVQATILNGLRVKKILENKKYNSLNYSMLDMMDDRCFGVEEGNEALLKLLNRGLDSVGENYGYNNATKYVDLLYKSSFTDYLKENASVIIFVVLAFAICIISIFLYLLFKTKEAERKAKEAMLEAQRANESKTRFLFNMSHDIRTPLNAISGFTDLLGQNIDNKENLQKYIKKMKASNEILISLINNILEMARIESGSVKLDEGYWNTDAFADVIESMFAEQMEDKGIKFNLTRSVEHQNVICDSHKIREIALNILSNAAKYTPKGGSVSVNLEELPCEKPGYALFKATAVDTGVGMSKELVEHIFDDFARERNTADGNKHGTGLGMPIVKRLVDMMDGEIKINSVIGKGTEVTVFLPLKIAEDKVFATTGIDTSKKYECFEKKRILLAEDNDLNAEITIAVLEELGMLVDRAVDGVVCVDKLQHAKVDYYDMILMDIQMPNMDGYKATETIRNMTDEKRKAIPIVAMTANAFEEDKKMAFEAGMDGHLSKPINIDELIITLLKFLDK